MIPGLAWGADSSTSSDPPLFLIRRQGLYGYIDRSGSVVISPVFSDASEFSEGRALVAIPDASPEAATLAKQRGAPVYNYGYIDRSGDWAIDPQLKEGRDFHEGLAAARLGSYWGYLDPHSNIVVDFALAYAGDFSRGLARVWPDRTDRAPEYITPEGRVVLRGVNGMDYSEGLAAFSDASGRVGYIDHDGGIAIGARFVEADEFSEGLARVALPTADARQPGTPRKLYGYITRTGNLTIPTEYAGAGNFSEGLARVLIDERWGYIDRNGQLVIPVKFDDAKDFSDGLAAVETKGQWGYIDANGRVVIPAQFPAAESFVRGLARIPGGGSWGYIDHSGRFVWTAPRVTEAPPPAPSVTNPRKAR